MDGSAPPPSPEARRAGRLPPTAASVVVARSLARRYQRGREQVHALTDVDLDVARGELLAVTGPSGGGKTTLLNLLGGLDRVDGGTLRVADVDLHLARQRELDTFRRDHVGYVLQFFNLIDTASARDNVALGLLARGRAWTSAREEADALLVRVGLGHRAGHRPRELSGGEQQRVAVARAIAGEPDLLLADEPTGELDRTTGQEVLDLLAELNEQLGTTVIVASHDDRVASLGHRTIRLEDGRLLR